MAGSNTSIHKNRPSYPSSSSSGVFYSLKRPGVDPMLDGRDTVSDVGMSPSRGGYSALHVDIPDSRSQQYGNTFDTYYNVNGQNPYLLGKAQPQARHSKQRSHSARRHYDVTPRQQVYRDCIITEERF